LSLQKYGFWSCGTFQNLRCIVHLLGLNQATGKEYLRGFGTSLRWLAGQKLPELSDAHFWYSGPVRLDGVIEKIRTDRTASDGEGDEND
jgi:hypothetical protein